MRHALSATFLQLHIPFFQHEMLLSWEWNTIKSARIYITWLFAQLFKYVLLCIKIYQGLTCKPLIKQHWYHKYTLQVSTETNIQYWFTSIHHCDSLNHKPIQVITYKYCVFLCLQHPWILRKMIYSLFDDPIGKYVHKADKITTYCLMSLQWSFARHVRQHSIHEQLLMLCEKFANVVLP